MPIYDYKCDNCGHFEKMQKISEEPLSKCPTCGGHAERIISQNIGIVFKGSGFYCTDHNRTKDRARSLHTARQTDNKALLDGDVSSFVKESDNTTKKHLEA